MAPKVVVFRCAAATVGDDIPEIEDVPELDESLSASINVQNEDGASTSTDFAVEYGYWQINHYRPQRCTKSGVEPRVKQWVSIPRGAHVHSYICPSNDSTPDAQQMKIALQPLQSCLRRTHADGCAKAKVFELGLDSWETNSNATTSTLASSNDTRRVHFSDGLLPDSWEESALDEIPDEHGLSAPLAEWIFIDRDICGYSLHEYAPDDVEIQEFASSPYAYMFLNELADVEFWNSHEQQAMNACSETKEGYRREERQLDMKLLLAGVHVNCIHAAPEELQQCCEVRIYETSI
jgi:hypothetical protein